MVGPETRRVEHVGKSDIQFKEYRTMKNRTNIRLVVGLAMLLGFVGHVAGPLVSPANAAPPVVEITSFGATYGEWSARWWQWLLSIPAAVNPNLDNTGDNCAQGQTDDVWFLAGTFGGGPVTRTCRIPVGKPIFLPLINTIAFKPFGRETLLDLRKQAADFIGTVSGLDVTIDGQAVPNLFTFRVRSPSFTVIAPPQGLVPPGKLSVPGNTDPIVSDGYWLLLSPLPSGKHVIIWKAVTSGGFVVDVTYTLTIQ